MVITEYVRCCTPNADIQTRRLGVMPSRGTRKLYEQLVWVTSGAYNINVSILSNNQALAVQVLYPGAKRISKYVFRIEFQSLKEEISSFEFRSNNAIFIKQKTASKYCTEVIMTVIHLT